MEMTDLIDPGSVVTNQRVNSKKQALQELAKRAAELTAQPEWAIYGVLLVRTPPAGAVRNTGYP